MHITFSTICPYRAKELLATKGYNYLSQEAKDYVIKHIGEIRVQDPIMYPKPNLEFHGKNAKIHHDKVLDMLTSTEGIVSKKY